MGVAKALVCDKALFPAVCYLLTYLLILGQIPVHALRGRDTSSTPRPISVVNDGLSTVYDGGHTLSPPKSTLPARPVGAALNLPIHHVQPIRPLEPSTNRDA